MPRGIVDEWRQAWKWLNVQLGAVLAIAPELYEQVKAMGDYLSPSTFHHAMAFLGVVVILNTIKKKAAT